MQLYVKFMFALAVGLAGIGVTLKTLLETLFLEWDPTQDARRWWRHMAHARPESARVSAEDILQSLEGKAEGRYESRPALAVDRRREVLRDAREADERVSSPELVEAL